MHVVITNPAPIRLTIASMTANLGQILVPIDFVSQILTTIGLRSHFVSQILATIGLRSHMHTATICCSTRDERGGVIWDVWAG